MLGGDIDDMFLVRLIREGDRAAFKHLFYKYIDAMERFVTSYTMQREAAQDIVSDIFAHIWEHRETLDIHENVKSYLFASARNRAVTWLNSRKSTVPIDDGNALDYLADDSYAAFESEELSRFIWEAVSVLPDKCREIFTKSRMEEMTNREIAESLNVAEKTVENQMTIAIRKLRASLKKIYSV